MKSVEKIVEEALALAPGTVTETTDRESLEEWDSLGHLQVLTRLDIELDGRAADIQELGDAPSVKAIKDILRARGILA